MSFGSVFKKVAQNVESRVVGGITSHLPFGVGAQYNQDQALAGAYDYYYSPENIKQGDATLLKNRAPGLAARAEANKWFQTLNEADQRQPLSMDPHTNFMNRQAAKQPQGYAPSSSFTSLASNLRASQLLAHRPPGLQVLPNTGQQPFGQSYEDDYTAQMAAQPTGFTNQTPMNGYFLNYPLGQRTF